MAGNRQGRATRRAVVLAGGKGTRLAPYTLVFPKPLMPIGDMPILEVVLRQLARLGFAEVILAVGHFSQLIEAYFGGGESVGVDLVYVREDEPLGTAGPLALVPDLDEPFLVMNGDLLTDLDYRDLYETHRRGGAIATVGTCKRHVRLALGVITYDGDRRITGFQEKPEFDYNVSMGVYIFEPRILDFIPRGEPFGFDHLMHRLLKAGERVAVYPFDGHWLDMGTPDELNLAIEEFEAHRDRYMPPA